MRMVTEAMLQALWAEPHSESPKRRISLLSRLSMQTEQAPTLVLFQASISVCSHDFSHLHF